MKLFHGAVFGALGLLTPLRPMRGLVGVVGRRRLIPFHTGVLCELPGLLQAHGPLVGCDAAAGLLGFNSRGSFLRAVKQGRVHLPLVRPPGRRKAFVAAKDLADYLTSLTEVSM